MLYEQAVPYSLHLLIMATISVAVALYAWRRRPAPGATPAMLLSLAVAVRSFGYALELGSIGLTAKLFWVRFEHLGMAIVPVTWLVLVLEYTGRARWLRRRYLALLAIEPLVTLLLAWTNERHFLVYSDVKLDLSGPFPIPDLTFGAWSWFDLGYSYLLLVLGVSLLVQVFSHSPRLYRGQIGALLIGALAPAVAELLSVLGLRPARLDLTPFAYTLTNLAIAWGLFRYRLLDIVPVARDAVVESMDDGVIVLDTQDRVADLNQAARRIVGSRASEVVGQPVARVLPIWHDLIERYPDVTEAREEVALGEEQRYYDLRISPLSDQRGQLTGRLIVLRDVTRRKHTEKKMRRLLDQQIAVNRLALALGEGEDLDRIYYAIYEHVRGLMDAETFIVSFYDDDARLFRAGYVIDRGAVCDIANFPPIPLEEVGHGTQSQIIRTGRPLYVPDWRKAMEKTRTRYTIADNGTVSETSPSLEAQEDSTNSALFVPMKIGGKKVGVMQVQSYRLGAYSQDDIDLLSAMANVATVVIQNARLYAEQQRRAEEAGVLLEIADAISSTLELDHVLKEVTLRAARACGASRCTILLLDERGEVLRPIMSQFASGQVDREMWRLFKEERYPQRVEDIPEARRAIQERHPLLISDAHASSLPRHWVEPFDVGSVLVVPLISRERVVGLMGLDHPEVGRMFTVEQVNLAMAIGGQAAVAIENARLHREVRNYAYELERRVQERTAELRIQYAQLEAILDSSSDGIIVTDRQGEILQTNPVAQTWLNRTLSPEDAIRLQETIRDLVVRAEERPETVLELTGLDLQLRSAPVTEPWMEGAAVVIAVHDVSHLKALDRVKSRFVSSVSHELRTPITTIKLYAELMRRQPERWMEYLNVLMQEADRQAQLVEGILQISRIDSGRLEIRPHPAPLNELTETVFANHRALAQEQGLTLEYHPVEPGPTTVVDPERMTQVLTNLVANAIQYTPEGGRVVISTGTEEAEGRVWVTATVADTGMGIPERELPHVFERFFRGEQPQLMQLSGTGLGLAIAKEIVALHGGRVTVESEVDVGTAFTVWLPLAD